jgi:hypothetical protein
MTGTELRTLRTRYGMTLQNVARVLKLKQYTQIWHWEHGTYPIPTKHQLALVYLFWQLARRSPPLDPCPLCQGSGLIKQVLRDEDLSFKGGESVEGQAPNLNT